VSASQLSDVYWFLVERGIDREPQDCLELLRRARPRSSHKRMRGMPRRAQDLFDAAQVLWLFLTDLTGGPLERTPRWPLDGRQRPRAALYDRGPATRTSREQLQAELVQAGLYPHAVHVVGEGESEREIVHRLVEGLLGTGWADEVGFTDLGGSGSASRLSTMVSGFTTYAQRTVVIVDSEGDMAQYVTGLIRSRKLPEEDVLRFEANLEDSNFSPEEMLQVLAELAASPSEGRPAVTLTLPVKDVLTAHEERRQKTRENPGMAGKLLKLAEDPRYGGRSRSPSPTLRARWPIGSWPTLARPRITSRQWGPCAGAARCSPLSWTESCPSAPAPAGNRSPGSRAFAHRKYWPQACGSRSGAGPCPVHRRSIRVLPLRCRLAALRFAVGGAGRPPAARLAWSAQRSGEVQAEDGSGELGWHERGPGGGVLPGAQRGTGVAGDAAADHGGNRAGDNR
jgi:hypothetical protein